MNTSFYNGISGVTASQFGLDTWANNITNINTTGFKANIPEFKNIFEQSLNEETYGSTFNNSIGFGATAQSTAIDLSQGALLEGDNIFDLAIEGKGWFGVQSQDGVTSYTRNGAFRRDAFGQLTDSSGNLLLGTIGNNVGADGSTTLIEQIALAGVTEQNKIILPPNIAMPGIATDSLFFGTNLDPFPIIEIDTPTIETADYTSSLNNKIITITGGIENSPAIFTPKKDDIVLINIKDKNGTSIDTFVALDEDFKWSLLNKNIEELVFDTIDDLEIDVKLSTRQEISNIEKYNIEVFSPAGRRDIISFEFTKSVPQQKEGVTWNANIKLTTFFEKYDSQKTYDESEFIIDLDKQQVLKIVSKTTGVLEFSAQGALLSNTISTLDNSGTTLDINLGSLYDGSANQGFDGFTSFVNADIDRQNVIEKNGYVAGKLNGYSVDQNGQILAEFTNGKITPVAKVAIFNFQNDQGLSNQDNGLFNEGFNSGPPLFFDNDLRPSKIVSNRLEGSNVDFSEALTSLILYQKALQASAKSITTSDQMLQNAINMKR